MGSRSPGRAFGLPDDAFQQRRPLQGLMTKAEVRAVTLYKLRLRSNSVVWDIGAGTGAVSVEAALLAHEGRVYAVEKDPSSVKLLQQNTARWGGENMKVVEGEAPEALEGLPDPDAVFIGGGGGRLQELLETSARRLRPGGRMVVNLATLESLQIVRAALGRLTFSVDVTLVSVARSKRVGPSSTRFEALNPVFVVAAVRQEESHGCKE